MFSAWGRFVYRHRRVFVVASIVVAGSLGYFAQQTSGELSSGGWLLTNSESGQVADQLATNFDLGRSRLIALFRVTDGRNAASAAVQNQVEDALSPLRTDPRVHGLITYSSTANDARFISRDGTATSAIVELVATDEQSIDQAEPLRALIKPEPGLTLGLTGYGPLALAGNQQAEDDLRRAETVSLPLAALILLVVFGSFVALFLPLLVAGLAIPVALGAIYFVAQQTEMSIYVLNVTTMLGLALAIDYSLFLVSRFREELRRGRAVESAVEVAVATAGKAVCFSGIAVAVGLLGLLFFASPAISSIGIAGSLVVAFSVIFALGFLPAVLGMLGPRVNALSVGTGFRLLRRRLGMAGPETHVRHSRWEQVAHGVMRHPWFVLVPTLLILLAAGTPFLRINQEVPDAAVLPAGLESRDTYVAIRDEFPGAGNTPFEILVTTAGSPTSEANLTALINYAARIGTVTDITAVDGPFRDPVTGQVLPVSQLAQLFAAPISSLPAQAQPLRKFLDTYVSGNTVLLEAQTSVTPAAGVALDLTSQLRALSPGPGLSSQVGGYIAGNSDTLDSMRGRTPWAIGMTMLVIAIVLFLLFGSVVLPVKAVFMTLLSIAASFGALVWIFQDGNLHELLGFTPLGYTIAGNPIIMFSVIFGLSMDYEVLLLSRIQEAYRRTNDNTASVAEGLSRTAGVITGAAMIMVCVFAAFTTADVITIKSIGVGMAIAVFADATIIRVFLVPATMRLIGRWNWWAPGPLGRLADRLGFSHVETEEAAPAAAT